MSYQKITVVGNAGGNAEMRYLPDGTPVVNFSVAVNERIGDEDVTTWFKVAAWNGLTNMASHIVKSQTLAIDGRVAIEQWSDKDGNPRANFKITAHTIRFVGKRPEGAVSPADAEKTPEEIADDIPF